MLHARVLRPDRFNATLVSLDSGAAERLRASPSFAMAISSALSHRPLRLQRPLSAPSFRWKADPQTSSGTQFADLRKTAQAGARTDNATDAAAIDQALSEAAHKLETTYTIAYIAHVPLEPRAAVAEWNGDKLTVWTGTQRPFGVQTN